MSKFDRPQALDLVLGSQNMAIDGSLILGGIDGVRARLNSEHIHIRIAALKDAIDYGDRGLQLILSCLEDCDVRIAEVAFSLLNSRTEDFIRQRVDRYLDDRELELQDLKYGLLESSLEDFDRRPTKKTKPSKNSKNPKTKPQVPAEIRKNWWRGAS